MAQIAQRSKPPIRQRHMAAGAFLSLDLDRLHFIGWEFAFAFDAKYDGSLSVYKFSKKCGVSPATIYKLFNGTTREPRLGTVIKIGKVLGYQVGIKKLPN